MEIWTLKISHKILSRIIFERKIMDVENNTTNSGFCESRKKSEPYKFRTKIMDVENRKKYLRLKIQKSQNF